MTVPIKKDISVEEIYKRAKEEHNSKIRARLLGVAEVLEGNTRSYAAKIAGVTINNIRTWIRRFNDQGFDGLIDKKQPGNKSTWTDKIEQYLRDKVVIGADFETDKRVVYRLEDLQAMLKKEFNVHYGISTIWYKLKELKLSWISVRQQHPKSNQEEQEEFKKKFLI